MKDSAAIKRENKGRIYRLLTGGTPCTKQQIALETGLSVASCNTYLNEMERAGQVLGENQRLPVWEALRAVTSNAAYALFEEGQKGTLSPGKRADLVLLNRNPLTCPPEELRNIQVVETIKDGETVYRTP